MTAMRLNYGAIVEADPVTGVLRLTRKKGNETLEYRFEGTDRHHVGPPMRVGQWGFQPESRRLWVRVPLSKGGSVWVEFKEVEEPEHENEVES